MLDRSRRADATEVGRGRPPCGYNRPPCCTAMTAAVREERRGRGRGEIEQGRGRGERKGGDDEDRRLESGGGSGEMMAGATD
eukprot:760415-Hanusia_phi.AAC.5